MKTGVMTKIRHFVSGTIAELGKCTWQDRASVFESTLLVLFMIAVLAVFVAVIDYVSQGFVRLITTF
jgi:preprotein translocase SecE subunit